MTDFTATNGTKIHLPRGGGIELECQWPGPPQTHTLSPTELDAIHELLQARGDEHVGRWRWADFPEYVVYPRPDGYVRVLRVGDGTSEVFLRQDVEAHGDNLPALAARAYFSAHPEPKPWHNAEPDEVWALTLHGREIAYIRIDDPEIGAWASVSPNEHARFLALNAAGLTAGRRIWPEVVS